MLNKKKNNKGFTLVELLVVIAIIGILAVVAVPSLMKNIEKSKAAKFVADYSAIKSAVRAEYADGADLADISLSTLVEDLSSSEVADYTLTVTKDTAGVNIVAVHVTIDTKDKKIATRLSEEINKSAGTGTAVQSSGDVTVAGGLPTAEDTSTKVVANLIK